MGSKILPDAIALLEARDWQGAHAIAQASDELSQQLQSWVVAVAKSHPAQ